MHKIVKLFVWITLIWVLIWAIFFFSSFAQFIDTREVDQSSKGGDVYIVSQVPSRHFADCMSLDSFDSLAFSSFCWLCVPWIIWFTCLFVILLFLPVISSLDYDCISVLPRGEHPGKEIVGEKTEAKGPEFQSFKDIFWIFCQLERNYITNVPTN